MNWTVVSDDTGHPSLESMWRWSHLRSLARSDSNVRAGEHRSELCREFEQAVTRSTFDKSGPSGNKVATFLPTTSEKTQPHEEKPQTSPSSSSSPPSPARGVGVRVAIGNQGKKTTKRILAAAVHATKCCRAWAPKLKDAGFGVFVAEQSLVMQQLIAAIPWTANDTPALWDHKVALAFWFALGHGPQNSAFHVCGRFFFPTLVTLLGLDLDQAVAEQALSAFEFEPRHHAAGFTQITNKYAAVCSYFLSLFLVFPLVACGVEDLQQLERFGREILTTLHRSWPGFFETSGREDAACQRRVRLIKQGASDKTHGNLPGLSRQCRGVQSPVGAILSLANQCLAFRAEFRTTLYDLVQGKKRAKNKRKRCSPVEEKSREPSPGATLPGTPRGSINPTDASKNELSVSTSVHSTHSSKRDTDKEKKKRKKDNQHVECARTSRSILLPETVSPKPKTSQSSTGGTDTKPAPKRRKKKPRKTDRRASLDEQHLDTRLTPEDDDRNPMKLVIIYNDEFPSTMKKMLQCEAVQERLRVWGFKAAPGTPTLQEMEEKKIELPSANDSKGDKDTRLTSQYLTPGTSSYRVPVSSASTSATSDPKQPEPPATLQTTTFAWKGGVTASRLKYPGRIHQSSPRVLLL